MSSSAAGFLLFGDFALLYCMLYCAVGLVGVGAVGETALGQEWSHFGEEEREFVALEIYHTKFFDARGVD